jgi:hypothetical protein
MEEIPLVKTQNLGIIESSILDCKFGSLPRHTVQHVSLFDLLIANTVENQSLNNTKILRFDQRNLFRGACLTFHRKT